MRVTLTIDDDVLETARAIARRRGTTMGKVVSEMIREGRRRELDDELAASTTACGAPSPDGQTKAREV